MKNYLLHIYWIYRTWPLRWGFPRYKIMTTAETIDDIINNKKSISRFGDGEFLLLIKERDINFQKLSVILSEKLLEVINNKNPKLLVALPDSISSTKTHKKFAKVHWLIFINTYGKTLSKLLDKNYHYGNANMTRLYAGMRNQSKSKVYFDRVKKIWEDQDVLIIEGDLSRLGVGNDLFQNTRSLERILCPRKNAFEKYEQIKMAAKKHGNDKLILCALGPTATVLCSELSNEGFWAVDIGHIDVEYMWMLMGAKERVSVKGRLVNESNNSEGHELSPELIAPYKNSIILDLSI